VTAAEDKPVTAEEFQAALAARHPGEVLHVTVLHAGATKEISISMASDPYPTYVLKPMEKPTDLQKQIYRSWLGLPE
jgi:predicted metalloprotease with PDZ domain